MSSVGEFALIDRLKKFQTRGASVVLGIGDDTAVLELDRLRYQLFTTDMLVEEVHFTRAMPPKRVGHKAMACSVSDIAAMGGVPTVAVISIGVPKDLSTKYIEQVYAGMNACARAFGVSIVGGDTVKADKFIINVALLGEVEKKYLVTRVGAKPGDKIFVTGKLGGSLSSGRHLTFTPRLKEARFLVEHFKPTAMMDISDGVAGDLRHILKASGVGALIDVEKIPCHKNVTLDQALTDGEDFELLFTLPFTRARKLVEYTKIHPEWQFIEAGTVSSMSGKIQMKDKAGVVRSFHLTAFTHF